MYFITLLDSSKAYLVSGEKIDKNLGLADPPPPLWLGQNPNIPKFPFEGLKETPVRKSHTWL